MRLALAGGGTGGHVVPGLHLLEHLRARAAPPEDVLWFSAGRAVEGRVLARLDAHPGEFPLERVVLALEPEASGAPSFARLCARTPLEIVRARRALARHGSDVLLALGGYTVLPAVLAARALGIPVVLLEINSVPGRATRALAGLAERVVHAWPASVPPKSRRHECFGPPLAPPFLRAPADEGDGARARGARLPGRPAAVPGAGRQPGRSRAEPLPRA